MLKKRFKSKNCVTCKRCMIECAVRHSQAQDFVRIETGRVYAIKDVLDIIMEMLPHWIDRWERSGFSTIREEWSA